MVNLSSQQGTVFKAAAACHPAMVDPSDAPGVSIPFAMLPSKDEDKEAVEKWQQGVKTKNIVEWFPDQVHGFMAARCVNATFHFAGSVPNWSYKMTDS